MRNITIDAENPDATTIASTDRFPFVQDGSPDALVEIIYSDLLTNLEADLNVTGFGYQINSSVSSDDLIVALKNRNGDDPSTDTPVKITINGTERTVSAALSVTLADGTNWFGFGSADKAALSQDLFIYLGYNATDGVVIGASPIPYAHKYGDFSATNTDETYCKISTITSAASADPYLVIGRLAATLSAGAGYTWTVPTYTPDLLVQFPVFETRPLSFTPQWSGLSVGNGTNTGVYKRHGRNTSLQIRLVYGSTTSISDNVRAAIPTTSNHIAGQYEVLGGVTLIDAGTAAYAGFAILGYTSADPDLITLRCFGTGGSYGSYAYVTSSTPHTWASTDIIDINIVYRN